MHFTGQVKKGIRRMPWHWEPKKDVTSCDKLRAGANIRLSADFRMRELTQGNACVSITESIGYEKATRGTETSKYPEEKKSTEIARVAASESAPSLNPCMCKLLGVAA